MSRDEVRKLIGGYATGTLTDAERELLFEAALEDQDLFDEIAGEQVFKELLDTPGVRGRMLAAVGAVPPKRRTLWWAWGALAGAAATGIALITLMGPATDSKVEIASAPPPQAVVIEEPKKEESKKVAPAPQIAQKRAEPELVARDAAKETAEASSDRFSRVVTQPAPATAAPVEERRQQLNDERERGDLAAVESLRKAEAPAAPPPAPAKPPVAAVGQQTVAEEVKAVAVFPPQATAARSNALPIPSPPAPLAAAAAKGKAGGAKGGAAAETGLRVNGTPTNSNLLQDAGSAGFYYERTATSLRIVPSDAGYLLVTAGSQTLFPRNAVLQTANVIVPLPAGTGDITIVFATAQESPATQPVRRETVSGTVTASPTASQLAIIVPPLP